MIFSKAFVAVPDQRLENPIIVRKSKHIIIIIILLFTVGDMYS